MLNTLFKFQIKPTSTTDEIVKSLILSFVWFYLFNAWIKLFWQILWWKSTFEDINLVTAYSMFIYVIINLVVSILWLWILASFGMFIPFIWFLVVYSKSLSKVQQFSESKVLVNVIVVAVIFYYLNKVITASLWAWMF